MVVPATIYQSELKIPLERIEFFFWFFKYFICFYKMTAIKLIRLKNVDILQEEVYEIDADQDRIDEQMSRSQADSITKQGYLLKGPDSGSDRMFANIGNKSFKRR